ncbi:hypothetical protein B296_00027509 [Ensete ventricosum]|uniref:Uncharacterized protein n=1 Tax=Ensete ventricosum TaxID=4639 RepID=A0A426ZGV9_ENSVE|nr:hypothetical protein B296_00027509 [Ensete ventricosum]
MSSTVLEVTRPAYEDVERPIVRELQREPANNRDRLFRSQRFCHMIHLIATTTDVLVIFFDIFPFGSPRCDSPSLTYTKTRTMHGGMTLQHLEDRQQAARSIFSVRSTIVSRSWEFFESLELGKKVVDSWRILVFLPL